MINEFLNKQIKENFRYQPTPEQENAIEKVTEFLLSRENDSIFLLKGFAGTGKTSLIGALVKTLDQLKQKTILLAPTGRAAKVFSKYADHPAYTIHRKIYRQKSFSNDLTNFSLNDNLYKHTLFIVDEASLIGNDGLAGSYLGSGLLLDDLVEYVYAGEGCRLLIMGDTAQLPPVGQSESPALSENVLKGYGLNVSQVTLTQVVRQLEESGILWNATRLREHISTEESFELPKIRLKDFNDIIALPGDELIETLNSSYDSVGLDETLVICRSNKRANVYNQGIRNSVLDREEELNSGDLLMIAKNNYYWTEGNKEIEFIANGDIAVVRRVRKVRELYGFRFADILLEFPDYKNFELEATVLLDTLHSDTPSLSREQNDQLFNAVLEDYQDLSSRREQMKKMKIDPYYNSLQVKYAYAVTCHKAQGGQWENVFVDQGYVTPEMVTTEYFRWLYTAFTRATGKLYLVNFPERQII